MGKQEAENICKRKHQLEKDELSLMEQVLDYRKSRHDAEENIVKQKKERLRKMKARLKFSRKFKDFVYDAKAKRKFCGEKSRKYLDAMCSLIKGARDLKDAGSKDPEHLRYAN